MPHRPYIVKIKGPISRTHALVKSAVGRGLFPNTGGFQRPVGCERMYVQGYSLMQLRKDKSNNGKLVTKTIVNPHSGTL